MSTTRDDAIKILITTNFLDKEKLMSGAFPKEKEATIMAIQGLRAWDLLIKELENYVGDIHRYESEDWNNGFQYAIDLILDHVQNRYLYQIEHPIKKDI